MLFKKGDIVTFNQNVVNNMKKQIADFEQSGDLKNATLQRKQINEYFEVVNTSNQHKYQITVKTRNGNEQLKYIQFLIKISNNKVKEMDLKRIFF